MKNLSLFFILVSFTLMMSCKKSFLDLTPEDSQSGETFYKTKAQFDQALTAAYTPLTDLMNNDFYATEMRSDNADYQYFSVNRGTAYVMAENIPDFMDESTNNYTNNIYFHCYHGISFTNIILDKIQNAAFSDSAKASIIGEAEFLRAFYYFRLVRLFGDVPLYLKETKTAEDAFLARSKAEDIYAQVIKDAKDAIAKLKAPQKFPQSGHASKGSATMLLADVYMTQHKYAEAVTLLESLSGMGYQILPDYSAVFSTSNKNNRESIFEVQYMQGVQGGLQSNFIYKFLPRTLDTKIITGVTTNTSTVGGWNTPTDDLIASYEPGDKRLDASIGIVEGAYNASDLFVYSADKSIIGYTPAPGKIGIPYTRKFQHPSETSNNTDDNWPVYRYSDALLLLAAALNEQGKGPEALPYVNRVRSRAGLAEIGTTGKEELRKIILHERRVELAFEDHRWFDLLRTGNAIEVMNAYGKVMKSTYKYLNPASYNVTKDRLVYPIPESEMGLNTLLTQNPGY